MGNTTQISQDHSETVIQRHGNAHPVVLSQLEGPSDEVAIVQEVEVTQRGALRRAGRAARKLDVAGIVRLDAGGQLLQAPEILGLSQIKNVVEVVAAGTGLCPQKDDAA